MLNENSKLTLCYTCMYTKTGHLLIYLPFPSHMARLKGSELMACGYPVEEFRFPESTDLSVSLLP